MDDIRKRWAHLSRIVPPKTDANHVSILIGVDNPEAHHVFDKKYDPLQKKSPYAVLTHFGWCIVGPIHRKFSDNLQCNHLASGGYAELDKSVPRNDQISVPEAIETVKMTTEALHCGGFEL